MKSACVPVLLTVSLQSPSAADVTGSNVQRVSVMLGGCSNDALPSRLTGAGVGLGVMLGVGLAVPWP